MTNARNFPGRRAALLVAALAATGLVAGCQGSGYGGNKTPKPIKKRPIGETGTSEIKSGPIEYDDAPKKEPEGN